MYQLHYSPGALHHLKHIPKEDSIQILSALKNLAHDPEPTRLVKKLKGRSNSPFYSLRTGNYRAILAIEKNVMVIFVFALDHRSTVYRDL